MGMSQGKGGGGQAMGQNNTGMWGQAINNMGASYAQPAQASAAPTVSPPTQAPPVQTQPSGSPMFFNAQGEGYDERPAEPTASPMQQEMMAQQTPQPSSPWSMYGPRRGGVRYNQQGYGSGIASMPQAQFNPNQNFATGIQGMAPQYSWNAQPQAAPPTQQLSPIAAQQPYTPPNQSYVAQPYSSPAATPAAQGAIVQGNGRGIPSNAANNRRGTLQPWEGKRWGSDR